MAQSNPSWGEERIANELCLKLGLTVSPRTVGRYLRALGPRRGGRRSQRWATFVRNHAHAVVACDFFTTVTVRFRILYVFVVLEVGTRRILHWNVTEHPTAEWTIQQFRAVITPETAHRFVLHDRDSIYAAASSGSAKSNTSTKPQVPNEPECSRVEAVASIPGDRRRSVFRNRPDVERALETHIAD